MLRVVIADDQADVRAALRLLLENENELMLVFEVTSADDLLRVTRRFCADLVLLDWELPGVHGRGILERVRTLCPDLRIIAMSGRPESRHDALDDGMDDFVSKGDPPDDLLRAVRIAVRHG